MPISFNTYKELIKILPVAPMVAGGRNLFHRR